MTALAAPDRSLAQRMEGLQRANDTRHRRMVLKRDLKAGRKSVEAQLLDPPAWALTMRVMDLLLAAPKYGSVKTGTALKRCGISPTRSIGGLSPRQRAGLAEYLRTGRTP